MVRSDPTMMLKSYACRAPRDHRQHLAVAEDTLGGGADVGLGHRSDQRVAAADIVDAEALEGDLPELVGDLGRGIEAERILGNGDLLVVIAGRPTGL